MAKSIRDFLHDAGYTDNDITRSQAEIDQAKAEVDHLIDHALALHLSTSPDESVIIAGAIRAHVAGSKQPPAALVAMLLSRSGQLAATVLRQAEEIDALKKQLEQHATGRASWWRKERS